MSPGAKQPQRLMSKDHSNLGHEEPNWVGNDPLSGEARSGYLESRNSRFSDDWRERV